MKRKRNPAQTKKDLLAALERIAQQQPENAELKERLRAGKAVKINKSNVEKEAGVANNAASRHPDVLDAIEKALLNKEYGESEISDDDIKSHPIYLKLKSKYENGLKDRRKLRKNKAYLQDELKRKDESLNNHLAHTHELLLCLWNAIPPQDVDSRMRVAKDVARVIDVNFKMKRDKCSD